MHEKKRRIPESATATARRLRRESTPPERVLWGMLRSRRLDGLKFRRQVPVAGYVVDFLCPEASLVVELDGVSHPGTYAEDDRRTEAINRHGPRVKRVKATAYGPVKRWWGRLPACHRAVRPEKATSGFARAAGKMPAPPVQAKCGSPVIRVTNHDLAADPEAVASYILAEARHTEVRPSPQPSP